jgi:hypothetical protein
MLSAVDVLLREKTDSELHRLLAHVCVHSGLVSAGRYLSLHVLINAYVTATHVDDLFVDMIGVESSLPSPLSKCCVYTFALLTTLTCMLRALVGVLDLPHFA